MSSGALPGGLLLAAAVFCWGAHAVIPAQLRGGEPARRRLWALASPLLLLAGVSAFLGLLRLFEDAALSAGLVPFSGGRSLRALGLLAAATLLADLVLIFAWRDLEDRGWRIAAGLGGALVLAAGFALGALAGGGAAAPAWALPVRAAALALLMAAAGRLALPKPLPRPTLETAAGLALPLSLLALPPEVRGPVIRGGGLAWLGFAAALLLAGRFAARPRWRRAALALGVLLASILWGLAAETARGLAATAPPADPGVENR